jgi:dienelactone hydrolase
MMTAGLNKLMEVRMTRLFTIALASLIFLGTTARAKIITKDIDYKAGDTQMSGFLAYDDEATGKRPGVIVVQEWWGNNDYPKSRAKQLAELGYVAFAVDMYGKGKTTDDPKEAGKWAGEVKGNPDLEKQRFDAGLDVLKQQSQVDPDKIGAIGYCFGGTMVLDAARRNEPLKGVVSFHGDLSTKHPAPEKISPKILVCTGEADAFVPKTQVEAFKTEMQSAGAEPKIIE